MGNTANDSNAQLLVKAEMMEDLLAGLGRLRCNGGYDHSRDGEFWFAPTNIVDRPQDNDVAEIAGVAARFQSTLHRLKSARSAFQAIVDSLDNEASSLTTLWLPTYISYSLASIPDEVLAEILERSTIDPKVLRLVSRRFHRIVSNLPQLWSTISFGSTHHDNMKLALRLSRDSPLYLDLFDRMPDEDWDTLSPYLHRAGSLQLHCLDFNVDKLNGRLSSLQPHRLHYLNLSLFGRTAASAAEADLLPEYSFYEDWYVPKLAVLDVTNAIPRVFRGMALKYLRFHWVYEHMTIDLQRFSAFLAACPALEELTLSIISLHSTRGTYERVELPRLNRLNLIVTPSSSSFEERLTMSPILDAFVLPNIQELNVTADFNNRGPLVSFLAEIFPYPARYPTLRKVHLAIRKASGPRLEIMKDLLKSLPNLRQLTVECQRISLDVEAFKVLPTLPSLETLCFTRCYGTNESSFLLMSVDYWVRRHFRQEAELEQGTRETPMTPMTTVFVGCSHLPKSEIIEGWERRKLPIKWSDY